MSEGKRTKVQRPENNTASTLSYYCNHNSYCTVVATCNHERTSTRSCSCTARNTISRVRISPYSEEQCEAQPRTALRNTYYREIVILAVQLPTSSMTATFQYNLHLRTIWDVLVVTYRSSTGLSRPGLVPTRRGGGMMQQLPYMQQIKSQSLTEYSNPYSQERYSTVQISAML